ncbi:MAG: alcohol dehydrogenase catalytic domain-containing protein [Armatimonadetes bacterium]|nr:alcohol dehydrogenase catalytic domain-containing protein [Armatimonadota bacterium]
MKGVVFLGDRECAVKEIPDPVPGDGEVVVRMMASGICGSDLHLLRGTTREGAVKRGDRIPGHEPSGVVAQVGPGVRQVRCGDRVSVFHYLGCGRCRWCAAGFLQWCSQTRGYGGIIDGAHADLILTDERNCIPLPEALSFGDGAFVACAGGTAYASLRKLALTPGETVAVFGLGPVGLSGVLLASALGCRPVGVDILPERLALAERTGAFAVVDASREDALSVLRRLTGGEGVPAGFEASGSAEGRKMLVDALGRGGRGVFVGAGSQEAVINPGDLIGRQLTLMGSFVISLGMAWEMVCFLAEQKISFDPIVTHRFPIEEAPAAYRLADTGRCGKALFVWE